jgi:hypothetical protein
MMRGADGCFFAEIRLFGRFAANDSFFARVVFNKTAFARQSGEIRLVFFDQRRPVFGAETQNFFVVTSLTGRTKFHIFGDNEPSILNNLFNNLQFTHSITNLF